MYFAAHCVGSKGLAPGTIHNYLCGIRSWYTTNSLPDPLKNDNDQPLYRLARVLLGIKKCHQVERRKRLPLTIPIMRAMVQLLSVGCFGQTDDRMRFLDFYVVVSLLSRGAISLIQLDT